jgi:carbamoyl-phosphate synthase large subunit
LPQSSDKKPRSTDEFRRLKKFGFSDRQLAIAENISESEIRAKRKAAGVTPTYRLVDTCAAEFEAFTPYYYSTYGLRTRFGRVLAARS